MFMLPVGQVLLGQLRHTLPFSETTADFSETRPDRRAIGNLAKPRSKDRAISNRDSLSRQDEKSRLKGILGIGLVHEDKAADVENHRPMTLNQNSEGVVRNNLISMSESFDQVLVGELSGTLLGIVPHEVLRMHARHISFSLAL
jgi:hypothetical protein